MHFPSLKYEKDLAKEGYRFIACIDEAGRGPLAGPVVAAAVMMRNFKTVQESSLCHCERSARWRRAKQSRGKDDRSKGLLRSFASRNDIILLKEVKDSKKLSPQKRKRLYEILTHYPLIEWGIGKVSHKVIDKINIFQATKLAMKKALKDLEKKLKNSPSPVFCGRRKQVIVDFLILDGKMKLDGLDVSQKSIVKADEKVFSCACASIIAKVTRDRIMRDYHRIYPQWRFDLHKGYGTKLHFRLLKNFGPCPIHRKSFRPVKHLNT